ncbi:MAG: glycosyltransferase family 2 protein [Clostridia bacterium]|nr:glycosyltransferase family 2 protein [Clostridia bacterium]
MERLRVSIALCTYNGEEYLKEQLQSFALQTHLPGELVVCDDCSKDSTIEILESFKKNANFPVRIYINEKNLRSTKNFEKAIGLCTGEIIALSDQDDVWHPEKINKACEIFSKRPDVGCVFSDAEVVDKELNPLGYSMWESIRFTEEERMKLLKGRSQEVLISRTAATGATMSFRSEYIKKFIPIDPRWVHDAWITLIIGVYANLYPIHEPLMKYRQHPNQQIGGLKSDIELSYEGMLKDNAEIYKKEYEYLVLPYNRIRENGDRVDLRPLEDKLNLLKWRAGKPPLGAKRLKGVLSHLMKLRYHRYGNGLKSAAKDLFYK